MRSFHRTLKGASVLPKTQRNRAVLFRARLTKRWRCEIHVNLKVYANAGDCYLSGVQYVISVEDSEDMLGSGHASTTYGT
jgi:hypothetical protein